MDEIECLPWPAATPAQVIPAVGARLNWVPQCRMLIAKCMFRRTYVGLYSFRRSSLPSLTAHFAQVGQAFSLGGIGLTLCLRDTTLQSSSGQRRHSNSTQRDTIFSRNSKQQDEYMSFGAPHMPSCIMCRRSCDMYDHCLCAMNQGLQCHATSWEIKHGEGPMICCLASSTILECDVNTVMLSAEGTYCQVELPLTGHTPCSPCLFSDLILPRVLYTAGPPRVLPHIHLR